MTAITSNRMLVISSSLILSANIISCKQQDPSHLRTHAVQTHGHACLDDNHDYTQPTPAVPSQQHLVNMTADTLIDYLSSKRHTFPSKNIHCASSPPFQKRPMVLCWPPVTCHDRELYTSTALAPSVPSESHAAESSVHHNSSLFLFPHNSSPLTLSSFMFQKSSLLTIIGNMMNILLAQIIFLLPVLTTTRLVRSIVRPIFFPNMSVPLPVTVTPPYLPITTTPASQPSYALFYPPSEAIRQYYYAKERSAVHDYSLSSGDSHVEVTHNPFSSLSLNLL